MKSEKELFNLAKMYATLEMDFEHGLVTEFEMDEFKENMNEIRDVLLVKKYDIDKFLKYKQLYKEMSVAEYFEFIKTLD